MRTSEYVQLIKTYQTKDIGSLKLPFAVLGLVEEVTEVRKALQTSKDNHVLDEVGDVCYYVVLTALACNLDPDELSLGLGSRSAEESPYNLASSASLNAGDLAGYVKKNIRDANGELTDLLQRRVRDILEDILSDMRGICLVLDAKLEDARALSAKKLKIRNDETYTLESKTW